VNTVGWFGGAGATALMAAICTEFGEPKSSALPTCRTLISLGANINAKVLDNSTSTAFWWALRKCHPVDIEIIKLLLENGVDLTGTFYDGTSFLEWIRKRIALEVESGSMAEAMKLIIEAAKQRKGHE